MVKMSVYTIKQWRLIHELQELLLMIIIHHFHSSQIAATHYGNVNIAAAAA